jgi:hypothetical protein
MSGKQKGQQHSVRLTVSGWIVVKVEPKRGIDGKGFQHTDSSGVGVAERSNSGRVFIHARCR